MMTIISMFALLLFSLASAQTPTAARTAPVQPPAGVWAKLDQTLNTGFTRAGDKISAVLQDEITIKDAKLPKGTKLTGTVMKSVNQDKQHPNSGLVLVFNSAVLKNGTTMPVKVTMASIAPSHSDEVEKVFLGSGAAVGSGSIAGRSTDATWIAANVMGGLSDSNDSNTGRNSNELGGILTTSSIKDVALIASPNAKSSGVVIAADGPLQLTKWTRINMLVSPQ